MNVKQLLKFVCERIEMDSKGKGMSWTLEGIFFYILKY